MEVPRESFHKSSWDSRTCYPRRAFNRGFTGNFQDALVNHSGRWQVPDLLITVHFSLSLNHSFLSPLSCFLNPVLSLVNNNNAWAVISCSILFHWFIKALVYSCRPVPRNALRKSGTWIKMTNKTREWMKEGKEWEKEWRTTSRNRDQRSRPEISWLVTTKGFLEVVAES